MGRGTDPSAETIAEADTLQFVGEGFTARNLLLTQKGSDLELTFTGVANTKVVLQNFALDNLDNLRQETGGSVNLGNILFDGQTEVQDSFDIFNADSTQGWLWNRNSVTFLNDLDNEVIGFENSDDVINGQGGNDIIRSLSGNDWLRGGDGNDILYAGTGADILDGGAGNNVLDLGQDRDVDTVIYRGVGTNVVDQFTQGAGGDLLSFQNVEAIDVVVSGSSTFFRLSDGLAGNAGFGSGGLLAELRGTTGFTADNLGLNLASSNTARFLFA